MDTANADQAYAYIRDVLDHLPTPVSVDLAGLTFCDACGLGAFARLASYAGQVGSHVRLKSPRPSLVRIMRITGLDEAFPELGIVTEGGSRRPAMRR
jgi:anti-anti-sigma factor